MYLGVLRFCFLHHSYAFFAHGEGSKTQRLVGYGFQFMLYSKKS
jgi:hypothetical protein